MDVDRDAPAYAEASIEIDAPPERVWGVLTDFGAWPVWSPGVKSMEIDAPPAPGVTFRWKAGPGTIRSVLVEVDAPRAVGWTGKTFSVKARHAYRLEARAGGTVVVSRESWDGLVVKLLRRRIAPTLQHAVDDGLAALKARVEHQD